MTKDSEKASGGVIFVNGANRKDLLYRRNIIFSVLVMGSNK